MFPQMLSYKLILSILQIGDKISLKFSYKIYEFFNVSIFCTFHISIKIDFFLIFKMSSYLNLDNDLNFEIYSLFYK